MPNHARELRDLLDRLRQLGWRVDLTRRGHYRCRDPHNRNTVFCPSTPSDHRALANIRAKFRRAGATL